MRKLILSVFILFIFLSSQIYIDMNRDSDHLAYIHSNLGDLNNWIRPYEKRALYAGYLPLAKMQQEREESGVVDLSEKESRMRESFHRKLNQLTYKYLYDITTVYEEDEEMLQAKKEKEESIALRLIEDLQLYIKREDGANIRVLYEEYRKEEDALKLDEIREILRNYPELKSDIIIDQIQTPVEIKAYFELDDDKEPVEADLKPIIKSTLKESELKQYQILWDDIKKALSDELLADVDSFMVYTDGIDETLAFVNYFGDRAERWYLAVDVQDSYSKQGLAEDFYFTMIHELGHVITLADEQVDYNEPAVYGVYFEEDMSAKEDSYLNQFYHRFWKDIYEDGLLSQLPENEKDASCFYFRHESEFPTEYGSTILTEDICEAFAYFVLYDKPLGNTIKEQKIRFFYEFEELVKIRKDIRKNLHLKP